MHFKTNALAKLFFFSHHKFCICVKPLIFNCICVIQQIFMHLLFFLFTVCHLLHISNWCFFITFFYFYSPSRCLKLREMLFQIWKEGDVLVHPRNLLPHKQLPVAEINVPTKAVIEQSFLSKWSREWDPSSADRTTYGGSERYNKTPLLNWFECVPKVLKVVFFFLSVKDIARMAGFVLYDLDPNRSRHTRHETGMSQTWVCIMICCCAVLNLCVFICPSRDKDGCNPLCIPLYLDT